MKTTQILSSEMLRQLRLRGFAVSHPDELNFEELAEIFWLIRSADGTVIISPRDLGPEEKWKRARETGASLDPVETRLLQ